jgi:hypothetical protein
MSMDILGELKNKKDKSIKAIQHDLLLEAYSILDGNPKNYSGSNNVFFGSAKDSVLIKNGIVLDEERIFSIKDIKSVCVDYRLSFLNKKKYKADLPYDVQIKSLAFEIEHGKVISFKILTEAPNFVSKSPNTQHLIFVELNKNEYYFIQKWGNEYSKYRKLVAMPYKNVEFLFTYILFLALIITLITPTDYLTTIPNIGYFSMIRIAYFFWCIVLLSATFVYYIVGLRKGLNNTKWDNPTFMS